MYDIAVGWVVAARGGEVGAVVVAARGRSLAAAQGGSRNSRSKAFRGETVIEAWTRKEREEAGGRGGRR